jgi:hypothetical protein
MANSIKFAGVALLCVLNGMLGFSAAAQNGATKKSWKFNSNHGELVISAYSAPNESGKKEITLNITPSLYGSWTVAEESAALSRVLDEFPKAGFDIRNLGAINLRIEERDAQQRIANEAALSKAWHAALKSKSAADSDPLIVALINQSNAYDDWNNAFNQRGLEVKVIGVDDVELVSFSKSGATCPIGGNCDKLLVPANALVQMTVSHLIPQ